MSIHAQERPAGFNRPARKRPTADAPKSGKQLAAEKKRERAQEKQRRREEKRRRREEKRRSRANRTPEARRRTRGRFAAIALIVVLLGLAAIVVYFILTNGPRDGESPEDDGEPKKKFPWQK